MKEPCISLLESESSILREPLAAATQAAFVSLAWILLLCRVGAGCAGCHTSVAAVRAAKKTLVRLVSGESNKLAAGG